MRFVIRRDASRLNFQKRNRFCFESLTSLRASERAIQGKCGAIPRVSENALLKHEFLALWKVIKIRSQVGGGFTGIEPLPK